MDEDKVRESFNEAIARTLPHWLVEWVKANDAPALGEIYARHGVLFIEGMEDGREFTTDLDGVPTADTSLLDEKEKARKEMDEL